MRHPVGSTAGVFQCGFYEGIRVELLSLFPNATINDLDDFVEELRTHGIPNDTSQASAASVADTSAESHAKTTAASSSHPIAANSKEQHVPVGGILVSHAKPKKPKKDTSIAPQQAPITSSAPPTSHQLSPAIIAPHPSTIAPISKPTVGLHTSQAPGSISSTVSHVSSALLQPPQTHSPGAPSTARLFVPSPEPLISESGFNPSPPSSTYSAAIYGMQGDPSGAHSSVHAASISAARPAASASSASTSHPASNGAAGANSANAMHLVMHKAKYGPHMELLIHSPFARTPYALLYVATHTHSWLATDAEVIVKLWPLSQDPVQRHVQQEHLDSEFNIYKDFNQVAHPNILSIVGRESVIESGTDKFMLLVMEKADLSLASFFASDAFAHIPQYQQQVQYLQPGNTAIAPPLSPLYRSLCRQVVEAFHFLHLHERFHQRPIDPSNIYLTNCTSSAAYSAFSLEETTPTIKVCDFALSRHFSAANPTCSDPAYNTFMSPEASVSLVPFGMMHVMHNFARKNAPFDGRASDLFSIGCVLYFICSGGHLLFANERERDDVHRISYLRRHSVDKTEPLMLDLINRLTLPTPHERPSLDIIRHHPALWTPSTAVNFVTTISNELEKSNNAGLVYDIIGSADFFAFAFPKVNSWKDAVLPNWLASWTEWADSNNESLNFQSIRTLLKYLTLTAANLGGGGAEKNSFGTLVLRRLHYFILALWSHLQQIGTFDDNHRYAFEG